MPGGTLASVPTPTPELAAPPIGGPTLGALADRYEARSARASENVRYLAGAGIAVVWMLSRQGIEGLTSDLLWTVGWCVGALLFDFLHYVVAAFKLGQLKKKYEDEGKVRENFITIPRSTTRPATILYWIKIVLLLLAFVSLATDVGRRLGAPPVSSAVAPVEIVAPVPVMCGENDATPGAQRD